MFEFASSFSLFWNDIKSNFERREINIMKVEASSFKKCAQLGCFTIFFCKIVKQSSSQHCFNFLPKVKIPCQMEKLFMLEIITLYKKKKRKKEKKLIHVLEKFWSELYRFISNKSI